MVLDETEHASVTEEELNLAEIVRRANGRGHDVRLGRSLGGCERIQHCVVGRIVIVEKDHPFSVGGFQPCAP